jgi:hypothetical protein
MINTGNGAGGSSSSSDTSLVSANLIDTCNFDFLDFLPELNSSALDNAINDVAASLTAVDNSASALSGAGQSSSQQYYASSSGQMHHQPNHNDFGYGHF